MKEKMKTNDLNPLLDFTGLPRFAAVKTQHITPAVERLLEAGYTPTEVAAAILHHFAPAAVVVPEADDVAPRPVERTGGKYGGKPKRFERQPAGGQPAKRRKIGFQGRKKRPGS